MPKLSKYKINSWQNSVALSGDSIFSPLLIYSYVTTFNLSYNVFVVSFFPHEIKLKFFHDYLPIHAFLQKNYICKLVLFL